MSAKPEFGGQSGVRSPSGAESQTGLNGKTPMASWFAFVMLVLILIGIIITSPIYGTILAAVAVLLVILGYRPWQPARNRHRDMLF